MILDTPADIDLELIKNYHKGSDLTILNTLYISPKKNEKGKWDNGHLEVVYKDNTTGQKKIEEIDNPDYVYYMSKDNVPIDHNLLFDDINNLDRKKVPYRELEKTIAQDTGNIDFFWDNLRNKNRQANQKLHTFPRIFFSDMHIEDNYRWRFSNCYSNNIVPITKGYFDIEVDGIHQKGDFPEFGECPVNAITIILEKENQVYTLLLRNPENPLIEQFEKSINEGLFVELKDFIRDKVGGWKNEIRYGLKDLNYNMYFYDDEIQLIADMFRLINIRKPDFMLAWNLNGFDFPYLFERVKALGHTPESIMCSPEFKNKTAGYYMDQNNKDDPAEKGDYVRLSSYTVFLDQLIQFASRRKGQKKFNSMKLDDIGKAIAKVQKLDYSHITTKIAKLPYLDYKTFVFYNIMDTIVQKCIEAKTGDVDYISSKCLINNTRYQKGHRQTVYLVNRARKEFYKEGFILGNNTNRFNPKPTVKFPGAFVANMRRILPDPKVKINGYPLNIVDNCNDFDFKSLYPSIMRYLNIAHNTQIGRIILERQIFANENRFNDDRWNRSIEFIENFQTHVWLEFGYRWLGLADYSTLYDDVMDYFTYVEKAAFYIPRDIVTRLEPLFIRPQKPKQLFIHKEKDMPLFIHHSNINYEELANKIKENNKELII